MLAEIPQYNEQDYHTSTPSVELLTDQFIQAISQYALEHQTEWEDTAGFDPTVHARLVGYTFSINTEKNVFNVYPVYEHDVLITTQCETTNTGKRAKFATHRQDHWKTPTVTSWKVNENQIFYYK